MKILKISLLIVFVISTFGQSLAYTKQDGSEKVPAYEKIIEKRYGDRLAKLDTKILGKLSELIVKRMAGLKSENDGSIAVKTQQTLDVYIAFANVIDEYNMLALEVESVLGDEGVNDLTITIIDDKRCTECQTETIVEQLKTVPALEGATYVRKDFSDEGVAEMLQETGIKVLPAAVFSHNDVGVDMSQYLTQLSGGGYNLALGAAFDPFEIMSARGFKMIDSTTHASLIADAHLKGASDAEITWIEYTDVLCHYCKKMTQDGTVETILSEYPSDVNMAYSNYIGVGGAKAQAAAEVLECAAKQGGATVYNAMMHTTLKDGLSDPDDILDLSNANGIDREKVSSCYENGEAKTLVAKKFATGRDIFKITGTPGNVLINNDTREYVIVSGAYPVSKFREVIADLLQ